MVDGSCTAPSGQLKGLSAGDRRIFHCGPRPLKGGSSAGEDVSSVSDPTCLNSMEMIRPKTAGQLGGPDRQARWVGKMGRPRWVGQVGRPRGVGQLGKSTVGI
jgi:hypothetical protein